MSLCRENKGCISDHGRDTQRCERYMLQRKKTLEDPEKNHFHKKCTCEYQEYSNYRVKRDETLVSNETNLHHNKERHLSE